jgi:hypothetical protein
VILSTKFVGGHNNTVLLSWRYLTPRSWLAIYVMTQSFTTTRYAGDIHVHPDDTVTYENLKANLFHQQYQKEGTKLKSLGI